MISGFDDIGAPLQYNEAISDYNILSVHASYEISKLWDSKRHIHLFVSAFNLLDESLMAQDFYNRQINTVPNRFGRSIHGCVKIVL